MQKAFISPSVGGLNIQHDCCEEKFEVDGPADCIDESRVADTDGLECLEVSNCFCFAEIMK